MAGISAGEHSGRVVRFRRATTSRQWPRPTASQLASKLVQAVKRQEASRSSGYEFEGGNKSALARARTSEDDSAARRDKGKSKADEPDSDEEPALPNIKLGPLIDSAELSGDDEDIDSDEADTSGDEGSSTSSKKPVKKPARAAAADIDLDEAPGALPAPLPLVAQAKVERETAKEQLSKEMEGWNDTLRTTKGIGREDQAFSGNRLTLPLRPPARSGAAPNSGETLAQSTVRATKNFDCNGTTLNVMSLFSRRTKETFSIMQLQC